MAVSSGIIVGMIIGGTMGGILLVVIVGVTCFFILKGSKRSSDKTIYKHQLLEGQLPTVSQSSSFRSAYDLNYPYKIGPPSRLGPPSMIGSRILPPSKVWGSVPNDLHMRDMANSRHNMLQKYLGMYRAAPWKSEPQDLPGSIPHSSRRERQELFRWPRAIYQAKTIQSEGEEDVEEITTTLDDEVPKIQINDTTFLTNDSVDEVYEDVTSNDSDDAVELSTSLRGGDVIVESTIHVAPSTPTSSIIQQTTPVGEVNRKSTVETGKRVTTSAFEFLEKYDDGSVSNRGNSRPQSSASLKDTGKETGGATIVPEPPIHESKEMQNDESLYAVVDKSRQRTTPKPATSELNSLEKRMIIYDLIPS